MGFLKLADQTTVKRYTHDDGESWIEVREFLTKAEMNYLLRMTPDSMIEADESKKVAILKDSTGMAEHLFKVMVVAWSVEGAEPTVDNYLALDPDAGSWIDGVLYGHLNSMTLSKDEQGKPSTSPRASRKGTRGTP